jgi:cell division protein ZapA
MSNELIPINILIGDRTYRIKTSPKDEETVRSTVKLINEKIIEFKTQFAGKDMQDYIAMVVIWYATQLGGKEGNPAVLNQLAGALGQMEAQIDKIL